MNRSSESAPGRRWATFAAALAGSVLLALGAGLAASRLGAGVPPAPVLATVPAGVLARAGITVEGASQPPYCDVERGAARGRVQVGMAGCAISREDAEAALLPAFRGAVAEATLARVSGPPASGLGKDRTVWLVVVRSYLLVRPDQESPQVLVFVDAATGQVITTLPAPAPVPNGAPGASV
ncbi:MAG TPA: PepSY domain-containing protein [Candidatus Dormibacteraeota bacterium]|nr:PepSY domain-containing protein [Candidatus Dormibacteraeota bacterium]